MPKLPDGRLYPKQVDIEVTSRCNLRCVGCPINAQSGKGNHMDLYLFYEIIDKIDWEPKPAIVPWLNGEPLSHPDYLSMIRYLNEADLKHYITTNGHYPNERLFDYITRPGTTTYQIIFSLDGLPHKWSPSIEHTRPGSQRSVVLNTIERFGEIKLEAGNNLDMAVKICKRGQDWEEIEAYIYYWLSKDYIDYVCLGEMLSTKTDKPNRIYPCQYSDDMFMVIRSDGHAVACAYDPQCHNEDYFGFGKVQDYTTLLDLYNNEKYFDFRERQYTGEFTGPCENCGFAYTGYGFEGTLEFRNKVYKNLGPMIHRRDYYNSFFTLDSKVKAGSIKELDFYSWHASDRIEWRTKL